MNSSVPGPHFKYLGDWLVWRSTGGLGDFRMSVCINIIANEGASQGWLYQIGEEDIKRILARYKEHVNYWNVGIEAIRSELQAFTNVLDAYHNFTEIATLFDSLPPQRIPSEIFHTYAQVKKEEFLLTNPAANLGIWQPAPLAPNEIFEIQTWLNYKFPNTVVRQIGSFMFEVRGAFTRFDLETFLHEQQQRLSVNYGKQVQYEIVQIS